MRTGVGREVAHEVIREHAVAVALEMREKGTDANDLFDRLAADERLGLSRDDLARVLAEPLDFVGAAPSQVRGFVAAVGPVLAAYPDAVRYEAEPML